MKYSFYLFLFLGVFFFIPFVSSASIFSRNLSAGSQGEDVRALQQELNKDSRTQIASSGPGSPGQETDYFGPLTSAAVVRFQELYSTEVLTPLGLSRGTGFFGLSTRAQINRTTQAINSVDNTNIPSKKVSTPETSAPRITGVTPGQGGVGTTITIKGDGFLPSGNDVSTLFEHFEDVSSADGTILTVTVVSPIHPDALEENKDLYEMFEFAMPYEIMVRNTNGISNMVPFSLLLYE